MKRRRQFCDDDRKENLSRPRRERATVRVFVQTKYRYYTSTKRCYIHATTTTLMSFDELRSIALWRRRWRLFVVDRGGVHFQERSHHLVFQFHPFQTRHLLRARVQNVIIQPTGFIDAPQRVRGNLHRNHPVQNLRIQPLPFRVRGPLSSRFVPSVLADVVPEPHGFPVVQPSFRAAARDEQVLEFRAELFRRVLRRHYVCVCVCVCVFFFFLSLSLSALFLSCFVPQTKKKSRRRRRRRRRRRS